MNSSLPLSSPFRTSEAEFFDHRHDYISTRESFGNLDGFFKDRLPRSPFPLSFCRERFDSLEEWRHEALQSLEAALRRPRDNTIASSLLREVIPQAEWTREEWVLETTKRQQIPVTVLKPHGPQRTFPTIIALHDMGSLRLFGREKLFTTENEPPYLEEFRQTNYGGVPLAETLVRHGYLVIIADALGFGQRVRGWSGGAEDMLLTRDSMTAHDIPAANNRIILTEAAAARCANLVGTTWAGMIVQDDILTVDFACSRDDVDVERIGCTGLSFGAYRANYLAAVDERIRAAVSVCWHSSMKGIVGYNVRGAIGWFAQLPELCPMMDISDIATLACPRAFLAISGWKDILMQPFGAVDAHRNLRQVWEKAGYPDQLGSLIFPAEHEYNESMQESALAWFDRHLGGTNVEANHEDAEPLKLSAI